MRRLMHLAFRLRAMGLLLMGRRGAAEAVFGSMLARWPDDAYALASRSFVRAQLGRQEEAIDDARRLVQAHPERSAGDWFNLAFLLESSDRRRRSRPMPFAGPSRSTPSSTAPGTDWASHSFARAASTRP